MVPSILLRSSEPGVPLNISDCDPKTRKKSFSIPGCRAVGSEWTNRMINLLVLESYYVQMHFLCAFIFLEEFALISKIYVSFILGAKLGVSGEKNGELDSVYRPWWGLHRDNFTRHWDQERLWTSLFLATNLSCGICWTFVLKNSCYQHLFSLWVLVMCCLGALFELLPEKVLLVFNKLHWFIAFIDLLEYSVLSEVIAFLGKHGRPLH